MHLAQHHFQAQSRYFEATLNFTLSNVFPGSFGFLTLEMDQDALWDGTVSILEASGVMPDGLPFHFGEGDPPPEPKNASSLIGPTDPNQVLYLSIPKYRAHELNTAGPGATDSRARYEEKSVSIADENSGTDPRAVVLGRKCFSLVGAAELTDHAVSLPIARVRADRSGRAIYDPDFIPPVLQIGASPRLMRLLSDTIELLEAKIDALRPGSAAAPKGSGSDLQTVWMRHAVTTGIAPLLQHRDSGRSHPQRVYEDLARLAGSLCTFSLDGDPSKLPLYRHDAPTEAFQGLYQRIRAGLDVVAPEGAIVIPLAREEPNFYTASFTDPRVLGDSEWVLSVRAAHPEAQVIRDVPRLVKICSSEDVKRLVRDANPALPLEHLRSPPTGISPEVGSVYFRIRLEGPSWSLIQKRSSVGVYVPDAISDPQIELIALPR